MKNTNIHHRIVHAKVNSPDSSLWDGDFFFLCLDALAKIVPSVSKAKEGERFKVSASATPFSRCKEMRIKISCSEFSGWSRAKHLNKEEGRWGCLYMEAQNFLFDILGNEAQETTIYFSIKKVKKG